MLALFMRTLFGCLAAAWPEFCLVVARVLYVSVSVLMSWDAERFVSCVLPCLLLFFDAPTSFNCKQERMTICSAELFYLHHLRSCAMSAAGSARPVAIPSERCSVSTSRGALVCYNCLTTPLYKALRIACKRRFGIIRFSPLQVWESKIIPLSRW